MEISMEVLQKIELSYGAAVAFLDICVKEFKSVNCRNFCMGVFTNGTHQSSAVEPACCSLR